MSDDYERQTDPILDDQNEKQKSKETEKPTCNKTMIIIIIITIIATGGIIGLIVYLRNKKPDPKDEYIQELNNGLNKIHGYEAINSITTKYTPKELSEGKDAEFLKSPLKWTTATAMGILNGDSDKIFYSTNLKKINATQFDTPWYFRKRVTTSINKNYLYILHIHGINYKSNLYIDGELVMDKDNLIGTFVKYDIDISQYLKQDRNIHYIIFEIFRPHNMWKTKYPEENLDLAISFVDWNPEAPDSNLGIWQPIEIEILENKLVTVLSSHVNTKLENDKKLVTPVIFLKNWENKPLLFNLKLKIGNTITLEENNIKIDSLSELQYSPNNSQSIDASNLELWWPFQMGKPNLYEYTIIITTNNNTYTYSKKIGLRQVTSVLSDDNKVRKYYINNKPILIKGAGWSPDLFLRESYSKYYKHLKYVKDMGLNTVRLEGKSEYEEFYDIADELGILLIPGWNCADAWQRWKYWTPITHEIGKKSMASQIIKLSKHPSVIIFIQGSDYPPTPDVETEWNIIFNELKWTGEILTSAADKKSEISGYPGVKMTGPYSWVPPHYFYFDLNEKWGGNWGFLTEGGPGENPLRKGSYERITDNFSFPLSEDWNYHCGNKDVFGDLNKIIDPINNRFGEIKDFEEFQKKSTMLTYDSMRAMYEAYTLNKYRSSGVIQWMLNNAWPSNIWHLYDYFWDPTPSYFATKKSNEKIHVSYKYLNNEIYLSNNYYEDISDTINFKISIIDGEDCTTILENMTFKFNETLPADSNKLITKINFSKYDVDTFIIYIELQTNDYKSITTNTYFISKHMDEMDYDKSTYYNLPITYYANLTSLEKFLEPEFQIDLDVNYTIEKITEDNKNKTKVTINLKNRNDIMALFVELKLYEKNSKKVINPVYWSDNFFSIGACNELDYNVIGIYENDEFDEPYLEISGYNINLKIYGN